MKSVLLNKQGERCLTRLSCVIPLISVFVSVMPNMACADDEKLLAPIVVTASRFAQQQTDALLHTTVITKEDIANSQALDLLTLLRQEAGIEIAQGGGIGAQTSLFMRGATPGQTLILIDGIPIRRQDYSAAPAIEHILPEQILRIEIVRGNVSAIYGSGAIGGVIQIFTQRGSVVPHTSVVAEKGSRGTFNLGASLSGQVDGTRYAVSVARFKTNGFSVANTKQYPNENPDKDGDSNTSFSGSISHEWARDQEIGAYVYRNEGRYGYDGDGFGSPTDVNLGRAVQQTYAAYSKNKWHPDWTSTITVSERKTQNQNVSLTGFGNSDARYSSMADLLQWTNDFVLTPSWVLVGGGDVGRESADVYSDYGYGASMQSYHRTVSDVYIGLNGKIDAHQLQFNLRHDYVGGSGSDTTSYFGYGYMLTPNFKLVSSISSAFRAPTLVQFYDPTYGNPNLKAERSHSFEVGGQYAMGSHFLRATFFQSRTRDQFGFDNTTYQTINIDRAKNRGVELSGSSYFGGLEVRASLTLQRPEDERPGEVLLRRARTLASLALAQSFGAWRIGADVQYTGNRYDKDFSASPARLTTLSPYYLVNLNARYEIDKGVSLYGRVENVFNRNYQTVYGANQPPRGIFFGVHWKQ